MNHDEHTGRSHFYATIMHLGKDRKFLNNPFILHPLEVTQILSTMTDDVEFIKVGILHDIVEDTDGTQKMRCKKRHIHKDKKLTFRN